MIFPAGYCIQALFKLPDSNEHPSLRSSELRRLKPIFAMKSRHLVALFAYYLLCSLVIALGFYAIPNNHKYYNYFVSLSGGMIFSCLASFMSIKSIMDEIQSFKSFLIHRSESNEIRKEIMESAKKRRTSCLIRNYSISSLISSQERHPSTNPSAICILVRTILHRILIA